MRKELIGAASAIALMTGAAFAQGTSTPDPSTTPAIPPAAADGMPAAGAVSAVTFDVMPGTLRVVC